MNKLKENIDPDYIILISEWWGLSKKPGARGFFVYPKGKYVKKHIHFNYAKPASEADSQSEGTLTTENFNQLKTFVEKNVTKNSKVKMFDYGCTVESKNSTGSIVIENDRDLFKNITDLIPFRDSA